ncbi:DUF3604 domain-containing protein [Candidatus Colwellia aromaticivorans]|uniref:DUF3604 domain-containing protein n=1 Tax=Candidatus Colwellia aromaticivorans TaxID=2267621 RepID=UPI000DF15C8E|nr:DUF3604 domain-containing protein [Candidatus Colwellia aromaticivorans]
MNKKVKLSSIALAITLIGSQVNAGETQLLWGDTHLHTSNSMDAYFFNNRDGTPEAAYRWAKGLPVINTSTRARIQIGTPLDFLVVSDHAEYMTVPKRLFTLKDKALRETEFGKKLVKLWEGENPTMAGFELVGTVNDLKPYAPFVTKEVRQYGWNQVIEAAEQANEPGKFTAFIGWEWTSFPDASNLHRVLFTPQNGKEAAKYLPFTALDSSDPEQLWNWLEKTNKAVGSEIISIPHNGNVSNGLMFSRDDFNGAPITPGYAKLRARWEPIYEVTQIKGDSETHPIQSPNDEFSDYETYAHLLDAAGVASGAEMKEVVAEGDYARRALRTGLEFEEKLGVNPFKFGLIGATDSHSTYASAEENNFQGKFSIDSTPEARRDMPIMPGVKNMWAVSAAGLSAVWAEENTRESIYAAFKRKEVYASTGPRIAVRFFGGYDYTAQDAKANDLAKIGYKKGVPMGGDLVKAPKNTAPSFLIHAVKDPKDANLDRIQVIKGWLNADGTTAEKVFDVVWSDNRKKQKNGKLPAVGNTVDINTGKYTNNIGTAQLSTTWKDPEFNPNQRAFYYARVLQIPTPRYSLLDAIALQMDVKETGHPATIQERAYSSPIWYTPSK